MYLFFIPIHLRNHSELMGDIITCKTIYELTLFSFKELHKVYYFNFTICFLMVYRHTHQIYFHFLFDSDLSCFYSPKETLNCGPKCQYNWLFYIFIKITTML